MFEFESLKTKAYFIHRMNPKLELHVKDIFSERSLQALTKDTNLIESVKKLGFCISLNAIFFAGNQKM